MLFLFVGGMARVAILLFLGEEVSESVKKTSGW
jgi:hypothetical protein